MAQVLSMEVPKDPALAVTLAAAVVRAHAFDATAANTIIPSDKNHEACP